MLLTENQLRDLIKNSLIKKMINENEDKEKKGFVKNMLDILGECKGKLDDVMWTDKSIDTQRRMLMAMAFNPHNDNVNELLKNHKGIHQLKKFFHNSPLEILLTNLLRNYNFVDEKGRPKPMPKQKQSPLIDLINDKSKHNEIVTRLVKTVAYRQKKFPPGKYRREDYTSTEAAKNLKDAWNDVKITAPSSDTLPKK